MSYKKIYLKNYKVDNKDRGMGKGKEEGYYINIVPEHLLNSEEFIEIWIDWVDHRKEIRKKLTPIAAKRQLILLGRYSAQVAVAMIDRAIVSSWQGIFELPRGHPLLEDSNLADAGSAKGASLRSIR
jgi:hypothetical protein